MSTFTLEQKRLEQIRKQLYGKTPSVHETPRSKKSSQKNESTHHIPSPHTGALKSDSLIKKDLMKVFVLSILAIAFQLLIHQALVQRWIHINFYGITY